MGWIYIGTIRVLVSDHSFGGGQGLFEMVAEELDALVSEPFSSSSSLLLSSLELSDTKVYEPEIRALLGTGSQLSEFLTLSAKANLPDASIFKQTLHACSSKIS